MIVYSLRELHHFLKQNQQNSEKFSSSLQIKIPYFNLLNDQFSQLLREISLLPSFINILTIEFQDTSSEANESIVENFKSLTNLHSSLLEVDVTFLPQLLLNNQEALIAFLKPFTKNERYNLRKFSLKIKNSSFNFQLKEDIGEIQYDHESINQKLVKQIRKCIKHWKTEFSSFKLKIRGERKNIEISDQQIKLIGTIMTFKQLVVLNIKVMPNLKIKEIEAISAQFQSSHQHSIKSLSLFFCCDLVAERMIRMLGKQLDSSLDYAKINMRGFTKMQIKLQNQYLKIFYENTISQVNNYESHILFPFGNFSSISNFHVIINENSIHRFVKPLGFSSNESLNRLKELNWEHQEMRLPLSMKTFKELTDLLQKNQKLDTLRIKMKYRDCTDDDICPSFIKNLLSLSELRLLDIDFQLNILKTTGNSEIENLIYSFVDLSQTLQTLKFEVKPSQQAQQTLLSINLSLLVRAFTSHPQLQAFDIYLSEKCTCSFKNETLFYTFQIEETSELKYIFDCFKRTELVNPHLKKLHFNITMQIEEDHFLLGDILNKISQQIESITINIKSNKAKLDFFINLFMYKGELSLIFNEVEKLKVTQHSAIVKFQSIEFQPEEYIEQLLGVLKKKKLTVDLQEIRLFNLRDIFSKVSPHVQQLHLFLQNTQFQDRDVQNIKKLFEKPVKSLNTLELCLSKNSMSNQDCKNLFRKFHNYSKVIQYLNINLSHTSVRQKAIYALSNKISKFINLKELSLDFSFSSRSQDLKENAFLELFQAFTTFKMLTSFSLKLNETLLTINQSFFDQLAQSLSSSPPNLKFLYLDFSSNPIREGSQQQFLNSLMLLPKTLKTFHFDLTSKIYYSCNFIKKCAQIPLYLSHLELDVLKLSLPVLLNQEQSPIHLLPQILKPIQSLIKSKHISITYSVYQITFKLDKSILSFNLPKFDGMITKEKLQIELRPFWESFLLDLPPNIKIDPSNFNMYA